MTSLHLVSHTHWDREWYLTFQQFRLRLVHLVDGVLDLLENDRNFKYFMLDGQTIVLEDYLLMRPENEERIRKHVRSGRLAIGPWNVHGLAPGEWREVPRDDADRVLDAARVRP
ncbi:MAG: alpha-mannosidase, partial [Anaerolineales bacterium]|nr:alpha-mannosidase [Anaerolineales bacterium]